MNNIVRLILGLKHTIIVTTVVIFAGCFESKAQKINEKLVQYQSRVLSSLFFYEGDTDMNVFNSNLDSIRKYKENTKNEAEKKILTAIIYSLKQLNDKNTLGAVQAMNKVTHQDLKNNPTTSVLIHQQLGYIYILFNDTKQAESNLLKAFNRLKKEGVEKESISSWLTQLYHKTNKPEKAIHILKESDKYFLNDKKRTSINLGFQLIEVNKIKEAKHYLHIADSLVKIYPDEEDRIFIDYGLGKVSRLLNDNSNAKSYFWKAAKDSTNVPNWYPYIQSNVELLEMYLEENKKDSSEIVMKNFFICPCLYADYFSILHQKIAEGYKQIGKEEEYYEHLIIASQYKDSVINDSQVQIDELSEVKNTQISLMGENLRIKNEKSQIVEQKNRVYLMLLVALTGFTIFIIIFYVFRTRKKKEILEVKAKLTEVELERTKARADALKMELSAKKMDLKQLISNLTLKQEFNEEQGLMMKELLTKDSSELKPELERIYKQMKSFNSIQEHMDTLQSDIENVNNEFNQKMKNAFPILTKNDIEICSLHMLNLSTKQIATIRNVSPKAIQTARYRIKKKMNLDEEVDLIDYIEKNIL